MPEINDFREPSRTLRQIAEYSPLTLILVEENDASQIDVGLVTGNYLNVMGLTPILGRGFTDSDDGAGAAPVIMLGHAYWLSHFAGDSSVVGKHHAHRRAAGGGDRRARSRRPSSRAASTR